MPRAPRQPGREPGRQPKRQSGRRASQQVSRASAGARAGVRLLLRERPRAGHLGATQVSVRACAGGPALWGLVACMCVFWGGRWCRWVGERSLG
eukprot:354238-Chlamydomonas_euryale.AAC.2